MNLIILALLGGVQGWAVFQVVIMLLLALILGVLLGIWLRSKNNGLTELREEFDEFKRKVSQGQTSQDRSIESIKSSLTTIEGDLKIEKSTNLKQDESIKVFKNTFVTIESGLSTEKTTNNEQNESIKSIESSITTIKTDLGTEKSINAKQDETIKSIESSFGTVKSDLDTQKSINAKQDESIKSIESSFGAVKSDLDTQKSINAGQDESIKSIESSFGAVKSDLDTQKSVNAKQDESINSIESSFGAVKSDLDAQKSVNAEQDESINAMKSSFATIQTDLDSEKGVNVQQNESIDSIKNSLTGIHTDLNEEKSVNAGQNNRIGALESAEAPVVDLSLLDGAINALKTNQEENNRLFSDAADAIQELDREKDVIDSNGKGLQAEIVMLKSENQKLWAAINAEAQKAEVKPVPVAKPVVGANAKETAALQSVAAKKHLINFSSIGEATESDKDDLKIIKGIGPFIEKKLNALDIWTFAQIASFNKEDVDSVTDAIEFFPGRIVRDNWVDQAKELK